MSTVAHVSQSHAIRVETIEERKQTPPACVYHGFDLVPVLSEAGKDAFEMIHGPMADLYTVPIVLAVFFTFAAVLRSLKFYKRL